MSEEIFASLASEDKRSLILQELQDGNTLDTIWEKLNGPMADRQSRQRSGQNKDDMEWVGDVVENTRADSRQNTKEEQDGEPWTRAMSDDVLIEHFLSLYFCWEYPIFATLSRQHFLADYRAGRRRYCSSLLVNAILAIGCSLSGMHETDIGTDSNRHVSGQQLFDEAGRLLAKEDDTPQLTNVQALGILSIFELSCGNQHKSILYSGRSIRMAVEMGLHLDTLTSQFPQIELEVRSATIWGAFALDK